MLHIPVSTFVFYSENKNPLPNVTLDLVSERVTAKEIIERAVKEQIALLSKQLQGRNNEIRSLLNRQYLSDNDVGKMLKNGKIALPSENEARRNGPISIKDEQERAIKAFKNGKCKIFIDGTELSTIDDTIVLKKNSKITFIRLIPLAGG